MKSIFFITIALILILFSSSAQTLKKTRLGVKGGFNHTIINGVETNGDRTGYVGSTIYGALFAEQRIGSTTFLNGEFLFSWVNFWHFIEVPVHVKQMVNKRIGIFAGPKLDFAADRLDSYKHSKSGDVGISAELGAQFNFTNRLFAEGRYSIGITHQFKDVDFDINEGRRDNLRFGAGFRF